MNSVKYFYKWLRQKQQKENNITEQSLNNEEINQLLMIMQGIVDKLYSFQKVSKYAYIFIIEKIDYKEYSWFERFKIDLKTTTKENMIMRYGKQNGEKRWKQYCKLQSESNTFEYKNKKFNMSRQSFDKYNKSRATTLKNLIKRHGKSEGEKIWKDYIERQRYTNTLEYFIEKYGYEGEEKWKEYNFLKSHTYDSYLKRFGCEKIAIEKIKDYIRNRKNKSCKGKYFSNISLALFDEIYKIIQLEYGEVMYGRLGQEYGIFSEFNKRAYFYDFVIKDLKLCIEFNGDIYHANPKKYKSQDIPPFPNNTKTSLEIWKHDKIKNQAIIDEGFKLIIVWEDDYRENPKEVVIKLIKEIKKYASVKHN